MKPSNKITVIEFFQEWRESRWFWLFLLVVFIIT